jgi:hypothetical protein
MEYTRIKLTESVDAKNARLARVDLKKRRKLSKTTAERFIRLAYDLEKTSAKLHANGYDKFADYVRHITKLSSVVGHEMMDFVETQK